MGVGYHCTAVDPLRIEVPAAGCALQLNGAAGRFIGILPAHIAAYGDDAAAVECVSVGRVAVATRQEWINGHGAHGRLQQG